VVWCGVVWRGVAWCGVVLCDVVWCGVVWCGVPCLAFLPGFSESITIASKLVIDPFSSHKNAISMNSLSPPSQRE